MPTSADDGSVSDSQMALVIEASNKLGLRLLKELAKNQESVFISPFSLSTALAMNICGSRKETRLELLKALCYENAELSDKDLSAAFLQILSSWENVTMSSKLSFANSILIHKDFSVKINYIHLLKEFFKAELIQADFANESESTVKHVNDWVKENTNGKVSSIIDSLHPLDVVVNLNAVHFLGTWLRKFTLTSTYLQNFYNKGKEQNVKRIEMMHQCVRFGYLERASFKALRMLYVGQEIAMLVLLPNSFQGLKELQDQLTTNFLQDLLREMKDECVIAALPKFQFEYTKSLKETFQLLGLRRLFESGADFGGMSDSKELFVSKIVHKTMITVNESGCEAVAVSGSLRGGATNIPEFIVDHPFLFTIYDTRNNLIIFLGRIDEL